MSEPGHDPYAFQRIRELEQERDRLKKERDAFGGGRKELKRELETAQKRIAELESTSAKQAKDLQASLDAAIAERDTLQAKITATPNELAAKNAELAGEIRKRDFRDAFRESVGDQLAQGATIDDLWYAASFDPSKVEALDAAQIGELVGKAKEAKPFLFATEAPGNGAVPNGTSQTAKAVLPSLRTAAEPSRGARDTSPGRVTYRASDLQDPAFGVKNKAIMKAIASGEATCLPD